ncbi:glycoprotein [Daphne virus 1]|nr:glycoprotein [Daphne virus 1]
MTVSVFSYLLITLWLTDIRLTLGNREYMHKISPVAICDLKKEVNVYSALDECVHRCSSNIDYAGSQGIQLMQDYSKDPGPSAVMCSKIKITQTFTETWTFSQIAGTPLIESASVSKEECSKLIFEKCADKICSIYPPSSLTPVYAYASDLTKIEYHIALASHPSTITEIEGNLELNPSLTSKTFLFGDGYGEDEGRHFFWNTDYTQNKCPLSDGVTMGCDLITRDGKNTYMCGGSRLAIDKSGSRQMSGACKGIFVTPGGILYKEIPLNSDDLNNYKNQKIGMAPYKAIAADAERVRILSQHAVYHIDADLCALQCEVSGMELRIGRKSSTLIRSGDEYILVTPKGHGYPCSTITHCKMNKPIKTCGLPNPSISVHCNGRDFYWDPALNYVTQNAVCTSPEMHHRLNIHIGNKLYSLDDDLTLNVSSDDPYTHKSRSYLLAHESLFEAEDLSQLRASWLNSKGRNLSLKAVMEETHVNQMSLGFQSLLGWIPSYISKFARLFSNIESAIIIVGITAICIFAGSKLWGQTQQAKQYLTLSRSAPVQNEMTWI